MEKNHRSILALALVAGVAVAACDSSTSPSDPGVEIPGVAFDLPPGTQPGDLVDRPDGPEGEFVIVCKTGPDARFDVWEKSPEDKLLRTITVADGTCRVAAAFGDVTRTIQVTELVPDDAEFVNVVKTQLTFGTTITGPTQSTDLLQTVFVGGGLGEKGLSGAILDYTNRLLEEGGEGCTPGHWKNWTGLGPQANHWPIAVNSLFSGPFDNAFSGKTMLQVLNLGGGGLNALGRHTVAAYLNALSPSVDYDLSPAEVISKFNDVFPGGNYEALKNEFEGYNTQGTPGFCD